MQVSDTEIPLSGVDPFQAEAREAADPLERAWFAPPASSRRPSTRPSTPPPPPIGDRDADTWFR